MPSKGRQSWHYDTPTGLESYYRTKALPSDYGPAGLLEQGQRRRIRRSRRTVLRDYGPKEAASSRRRALGTKGPFQGPRVDREQRQLRRGRSTIQGTTGRDGSAGRLCRSTPQQADDTTTRPSGSGPASQSDARDFGRPYPSAAVLQRKQAWCRDPRSRARTDLADRIRVGSDGPRAGNGKQGQLELDAEVAQAVTVILPGPGPAR